MQKRLDELAVLLNGNTINRFTILYCICPTFPTQTKVILTEIGKKKTDKGYDKQILLNG
jgi:hypothetical protein